MNWWTLPYKPRSTNAPRTCFNLRARWQNLPLNLRMATMWVLRLSAVRLSPLQTVWRLQRWFRYSRTRWSSSRRWSTPKLSEFPAVLLTDNYRQHSLNKKLKKMTSKSSNNSSAISQHQPPPTTSSHKTCLLSRPCHRRRSVVSAPNYIWRHLACRANCKAQRHLLHKQKGLMALHLMQLKLVHCLWCLLRLIKKQPLALQLLETADLNQHRETHKRQLTVAPSSHSWAAVAMISTHLAAWTRRIQIANTAH